MSSLTTWNDYEEGLHIEWPFYFSMEQMNFFAKLSGDFNPIHIDPEYAKSKGFKAPVVYGLLLATQMSRLIGQELPDNNAMLIGIQMDFISPCYPDDKLIFGADLINKSDATHSLEFKCHIFMDRKTLCRGLASAVWRP
jgi:acyl dehydratase